MALQNNTSRASQGPKDYFSAAASKSIKASHQKRRPGNFYPPRSPPHSRGHIKNNESVEKSRTRLAHRSTSDQERPKPAVFKKNSVLETTERLHIRDSPTMATVMELHQRQLDISTMSNNVSYKNSRLMNDAGSVKQAIHESSLWHNAASKAMKPYQPDSTSIDFR